MEVGPGVNKAPTMFNIFKQSAKRNMNQFRCYAYGPCGNMSDQDNGEDLEATLWDMEVTPQSSNPELKDERNLNVIYKEKDKEYHLTQILNHNKNLFIKDICQNVWGFEFHHSEYTVSNGAAQKRMLKHTATRDPLGIGKLSFEALNKNLNRALGVNLSSNKGRYAKVSDLVMLDMDPTPNNKYNPLL